MRKVTTNKAGKALVVEVAVGLDGWKFPENFLTASNSKGKEMYQIPVTYHEIEDADKTRTLGDVVAEYAKLGITDAIGEMNAGLRLAFGDLAKAPYREQKENQQKRIADAMRWLLVSGGRERIAAFQALPEAEQTQYLLSEYDSREV